VKKKLGLFVFARRGHAGVGQQDFSKVEIQAQPWRTVLHAQPAPAGNIGLSVGDEAVFMVDDQFAPLTPEIRKRLRRFSPKPGQVPAQHALAFSTYGRQREFRPEGAVISRTRTSQRMSVESFIEFLGMKVKAEPRQALPVVTFASGLTLTSTARDPRDPRRSGAHRRRLDRAFRQGRRDPHGRHLLQQALPLHRQLERRPRRGRDAAADRVLEMAGAGTKIIPGHGPLANGVTSSLSRHARDRVGHGFARR